MKLDESWASALHDDDFSAARSFRITAETRGVPTRFDIARNIVRNKRVLHVGCVDHLPLLDAKLRDGTWMHDVLSRSAAHCGGIDINERGIKELRERGYGDLWLGNVTDPPHELVEEGWDLMFLGEILEHTDDPIGFLDGIADAWTGTLQSLVVTVPNAFAWSSLRGTIRGVEYVNTDHRYWFTPYTMAKVAVRAGFDVEALHLCESFPANPSAGIASRVRQRALTSLLARRPIYCSSVVAVLNF